MIGRRDYNLVRSKIKIVMSLLLARVTEEDIKHTTWRKFVDIVTNMRTTKQGVNWRDEY